MKINKYYIILVTIVISVLLGVWFLTQSNINYLLKEDVKDTNIFSKSFFDTFKSQDIKALSTTLDSLLQDPGFKEVFLKNNRDELNQYGQSLFQKLKVNYGITHFYFMLPDGTIFLRLHSPGTFGDMNNRLTFKQAVESKTIGSGIELGKTAFALRVVKPYYDGQKLIGYLELGQEINHFLSVLKKETNNDYAIFVKKDKLDPTDWANVRKNAGLNNNWTDYNEMIMIESTSAVEKDSQIASCLNEVNAGKIFNEKLSDYLVINTGINKACTGFTFTNPLNEVTGVVLLNYDITEIKNSISNYNNSIMIIIYSLIIITIISFIFFTIKNKKNQEKYIALYNYSLDAVMTLDANSAGFTGGNPAAIKLFNVKDNTEFISLKPSDLSPEYQPDGRLSGEKAKEMIGIALDKGDNVFDWTHKKYNGPEFLARVSLVRLGSKSDHELQATVRDITLEKESLNLINKSATEAKKALDDANKMNKLMVGRELDMIKLKEEIAKFNNK